MVQADAKSWFRRALVVWVASLLAGLAVIVLADVGGPVWAFVLLGAWLWTVGLPTTAGVVAAAALWGGTPLLMTNSLTPFLAFAAILGGVAQVGAFLLLGRLLHRRSRRREAQ